MTDLHSSNRRIAKNTMFLYLRMLVSLVVNLYTVRLLWRVLGVDNYGIYNVVGGIVLVFSFLNYGMIASSQRFIAFELGRGDMERLRRTFSISLTIHIIIALIVLVIAETVGLWFLNVKLNIPITRVAAANWVYQFSVITFLITIISVPYNACIVAHEHIKIYGYFGILEVFAKLGIVVLTGCLFFDHLITYAFLLMVLAVIMRIVYGIYCARHFQECHFKHFKDPHLMRQMFGFGAWSFLGSMGLTVREQGINFLLNIFFSVAVNAAKGVATQAGNAINGVASNFTMALNPQITKRYAANDIEGMVSLMTNGCKYSLILMGLVVVPLFYCAPLLLKLWLGNVAPYTVGFLQLILIQILIECSASPIVTGLQATGIIRKFQICVSLIMVSVIPITWLWLQGGGNPYSAIYVVIASGFIALMARIMILHNLVPFSYSKFFIKAYLRPIIIISITSAVGWYLFPYFHKNLIGAIGYLICSVLIYCLLTLLIGLNIKERQAIKRIIFRR